MRRRVVNQTHVFAFDKLNNKKNGRSFASCDKINCRLDHQLVEFGEVSVGFGVRIEFAPPRDIKKRR